MNHVLDRADLNAGFRAWAALCARGLDSELSYHVIFAPWRLCTCPKCVYDAAGGNDDA